MKVSIICGVYNAEQYLHKCINSMLHQTYKNIEIILVVNASTDDSKDIVKKYQEENPKIIKAYYIEEKLGAGGSRQFGLEHSSGEYICFVDCDDELEADYVYNMMDTVRKNLLNTKDIIICNFKKIDKDGKVLYVRRYKNKDAALIQSVAPWGKMFRRKYLEDNNMILRNIPFGEDVIFASEIILTNPNIELCDYIGYIWNDNPRSTSHTELRGFPKGTVDKSKEYFEYMKHRYLEKEEKLNYFMYKYYIWYLLQSGRNVPAKDMKEEYDRVFNYLYVSDLRCKNSTILRVKGERIIVKLVLSIVKVLEKLHLSRPFFVFYSQSFLGRFWPSL